MTHQKNIVTAGVPLAQAKKALIMIHGRGATAQDIISLATYLNVGDYALIAPQASGHTWYPYSFMAPVAQNEPGLSSAITVINSIVDDILKAGIPASNIYFMGFSQGACLTLEYVTRHAQPYGGVVAFTGGLIGAEPDLANYHGDFNGTPVFIGSSDPDMHVPVTRVRESEKILKNMGADITVKLYPGMGHTVSQDEVETANKLVFK
ncbi:alpha/beta hydrolase [Chitinophaga sancti]|uniref:Dienelactone hydrolase family protein n=1 Tax=Chitinophaga sancti TaxID=1004 RepID=A0A1K1R2R4_9BACT|nr:dienelactone hydrolase family protein [Chitinophaga sancti]WQD64324.1 dienelactone hydrolase family protein [Chitinophaga sancti]WQG90052.1 dienelactone hydrolase family protein [Chitinophaga sancti]SFW66416.1 phospholipase/carboxylesterase [Chitinophaga sancti]